MQRGHLRLSEADFVNAWAMLRPGTLPPVLASCLIREVASEAQRAGHVAATMERLRERDLADQDGLRPEIAGPLTLLGNARWAVEARLNSADPDATETTGGSMRAYGAAGGDAAVITAIADGQVTLTSTTAHRLVSEVVALAGDVPAGPGRSINLHADALARAAEGSDRDPDRFAELLVDNGLQPGEASMLARVNGGHLRSGQFEVVTAGADGTMRSTHRTVTFIDTANGRWAQRVSIGPNGQPWATVTPTAEAQLVTMVAELRGG